MQTPLNDVITRTHDTLSEQLDKAQAALPDTAGTRRGFPPIDRFIAGASQHLHAVDTVLMPQAREMVPDRCEDFAGAEHELSFALEHLRRRLYGSTYEKEISWPEQWDEVRTALRSFCAHEDELVSELSERLDDRRLAEVGGRLATVRQTTPPRPHPYLPKRGPLAPLARRLARWSDVFMDTVDDRYSPAAFESPENRTPRRKKGAMSRYLTADPDVDADQGDPPRAE